MRIRLLHLPSFSLWSVFIFSGVSAFLRQPRPSLFRFIFRTAVCLFFYCVSVDKSVWHYNTPVQSFSFNT